MRKIERKEFEGKSINDIQAVLDKELADYAALVETMSVEDLQKEEQEIISAQDEYSVELDGVEYKLPDSIVFEGKPVSRSKVMNSIIYFLNKIEVEWSYTLGLYQLVKLWKDATITAIPYKAYDSTLRTLNQVKFKGSTEWEDILTVNDYLSSCHQEYTKDTYLLVYYSELHNRVIDKLTAIQKEQAEPETK